MSQEVLDESAVGAEATPEQEVQEIESPQSLDDLKALAAEDEDEEEVSADDGSAEEEVAEVEDGAEQEEIEASAPAKEEYVPDYKLKAGGEEIEIPEVFRAAITSKEAEEQFKEVFRKAHGLPQVEQSRDKYKEDFNALYQSAKTQDDAVQTLDGYLKNKDLHSFFTALEIPIQDVMKYALEQAELQAGTPEQRQAFEAQVEAKRRANMMEQSYNSNEQQLLSLQQDKVVQDYRIELFKPEVQAFEKAFNQSHGDDAFEAEVGRLGEYYEKVHGDVRPVSQLVEEVMGKFGPLVQQTQQQSSDPAAANPAPSIVPPEDLPVIPNTGPSGRAPAQKAIRSIEDLEKIADSI